MGWNFRKSFTILPGIRLNFGKRGFTSASIGPRGVKLNVGKKGTFVGASIPGTGLYYRERIGEGQNSPNRSTILATPVGVLGAIFVGLLILGFVLLVYFLIPDLSTPSPSVRVPARTAEVAVPRRSAQDTVDYSSVIKEAKATLSSSTKLTGQTLDKLAIALVGIPDYAPEYVESRSLMHEVDRRRSKEVLTGQRSTVGSKPQLQPPSFDYPPNDYMTGSTGRVNVRGYYRKDGTYVRPHTRRR